MKYLILVWSKKTVSWKVCSEEVASKLWSKATGFRIVAPGSDEVYVQAIKELEVRDGFSLPQKVESSVVPL